MNIDGPAPLWLDLDGWRDLDDIRRQVAAHPEASLRLVRDLRRLDAKRMRPAVMGPTVLKRERRSPLRAVAVIGIVTVAVSMTAALAVIALLCGWRW